jgi:hypothetical protein
MNDARIENKEARDPLEAELELMRPLDLPPALFARVGAALAPPITTRRPRAWWLGAVAAAAACVGLAAVVWRTTRPSDVGDPPTIVRTLPTAPDASAPDSEPPALATYHRALAGTPEALDALLDRHAARSLPGGARVTASSDFTILR